MAQKSGSLPIEACLFIQNKLQTPLYSNHPIFLLASSFLSHPVFWGRRAMRKDFIHSLYTALVYLINITLQKHIKQLLSQICLRKSNTHWAPYSYSPPKCIVMMTSRTVSTAMSQWIDFVFWLRHLGFPSKLRYNFA